jgi:ADP-ribosylglycohydrolase
MTPDQLREKIYAGIIGKAAGVRLGAPVEPTAWDHDRIRDTYGELTGYVRDYRNFAADDDTNGPFYFVRPLWDEGELTPESAGRNWLNYIADGHGMLWWGGFGISTEQTAYEHLQAGIVPPETGSIERNGIISAEQIGGQIFSDCWGWVNPGAPAKAAKMAKIAASVSHDGEALEGAAYVAAATAAAFDQADIQDVHNVARSYVKDGTAYARVLDAVAAWHKEHPDDWRSCFAMLERDFGYDKWTGVCHVIPNAGVVCLGLLYGQGDMPRTIEITTMCGWDTDCNAGNAGSIAGILQGVQKDWDKYRRAINDILITSAVTGAMNIVDMPSFARDLTVLALRQSGHSVPENWEEMAYLRGVDFDFSLPGASHGIRAEGSHRLRTMPGLSENALSIQIDRWAGSDKGRVFWKPFYRESDFDDNRYRPMLSPVTASGQSVTLTLRGSQLIEGPRSIKFVPYIRRVMSGLEEELGTWAELPDDWQDIKFTLPEGDEAIDEIGIKLCQQGDTRTLMYVELQRLRIEGTGHTVVDPAIEAEEWGSISRFTFNRGKWSLKDDCIVGETDSDADLWTGHHFATDQTVSAEITPISGSQHLVVARASGTSRYYAGGIVDGQAVIIAEDFGTTYLAKADIDAPLDAPLTLSLSAIGDALSLSINGKTILNATDQRHLRGMAGLRIGAAGKMSCRRFEIMES